MRALTLHQPWAWAIAHADKRIENRTWYPPSELLGREIAIHAGKRFDEAGAAWMTSGMGSGCEDRLPVPEVADTVFGAVVAVARLYAATERRPDESDPRRRWWAGPVGWLLQDVVALPTPVPCRGAQGLWILPADVEAEVLRQISSGGSSA